MGGVPAHRLAVPELRVINGGAGPVLILEEDELVGARQNRVLYSSVLVAAESQLAFGYIRQYY